MKRQKLTAVILILVLLLTLIPSALAAVGSGWDDECRYRRQMDNQGNITYGKHDWIKQSETPGSSCTQKGSAVYSCSHCGTQIARETSAPGHKWGSWKTTKEATCSKKGEQTRKCSVCGRTETRETDRKAHSWGEWTVITEPTDFSMGTHSHVCQVCGREKTEDFYPDPTYKKGDKGSGVKDLQEKLNAAGYDCGKADGDFGKKTEEAVKAIEADHGVEADGIAWPGVQKWLNGPAPAPEAAEEDEYGWEPPEDEGEPEEEPETPDGVGGPGDEVSPASYEPSELYDVTVGVEDTTGWKYGKEPFDVHVTFTNTGKKAVDVFCDGVGPGGFITYKAAVLSACDVGAISTDEITHWTARLEPGQSGVVTARINLTFHDADQECLERKLPAWFSPPEASDPSGHYPEDWPWEPKGRKLEVSFTIDKEPPALVQSTGGGVLNVGDMETIVVDVFNRGPYLLYKLESDVYDWDKDAQDYVFSGTYPISEWQTSPTGVGIFADWDNGDIKTFEVTKQLVEDTEDGVLRFKLKSRSWTKAGTPVETDFEIVEFILCDCDVLLEVEDISAGKVPEDGWVKVGLKATNIGSEVMEYRDTGCFNPSAEYFTYHEFSTKCDEYELHDCELPWMAPGTSWETELWIKVYDADVKSGEVRRFASMGFYRLYGEDEKRLTAEDNETAVKGKTYGFNSNDVEIVVPLLKTSEAPSVAPPPAPQAPACCVPALTGLGEGTAEWTLTRCPEHWAVAKAANKLLAEAEDDAAKLAACEGAVQLWSDALNAEYNAMLAKAGDAEKALIEAEKAAFEAQLTAHQAALALDHDPAVVARQIADLLMKKTAEICYERHTAPKERADLYAAATETLPAAGGNWRCETRTDGIGAALLVTEALCEEHRAIEALAAEARDAESWREVKRAWLAALDSWTNARYYTTHGDGKALVANERTSFGQWLAAREALLNRLYPNDSAVVQELLAQAIRARVLENCAD